MHRAVPVVAASLMLWATSGAHAQPRKEVCAKATKAQIETLFDRWNAALQTRQPAKVAALYTTDAVLLPTVSNEPRTDAAGIKAYFDHFLTHKPAGKIDSRTIHIGCNTASDVGIYTFTLAGAQPGTTETVKARYSFVYVWRNNKWLILHHHSSALPQPAS